MLLFIDQFEELFTQTTDITEREQFLHLLTSATTEPDGALVLVLTLRADFYDRPMQYPEFYELLQTHQIPILPLKSEELRAVIEQPAAQQDVNLSFEADLIGDLLFELRGQAGALPLLQFTLEQLYTHRQGHFLTRAAYRTIGGVRGALAQHAENTYLALSSQEQHLASVLFKRLIDPGERGQDLTRRRITLTELTFTDRHTTQLMEKVVQTFVESRLLTTSKEIETALIEVSHEAILSEWRRLANWVQTSHEDIHLHKAIQEAATAWRRRGKPTDHLYRGSQLAEAQQWQTHNLASAEEEEFLQASKDEEEQQQKREHEHLLQEVLARQRYTRRAFLIGTGLFLLAGAAGAATTLYLNRPTPKNRPYTYHGHTHNVTSIAWTPDGKQLASASYDRTTQIWEAATGTMQHTYRDPTNGIESVAFSPDGSNLASGNVEGAVSIWETSTRKLLHTYRESTSTIESVAFSPDGKLLASGSSDKTVQVWEASTGKLLHIYRSHTATVYSVAWAPDGKRLASGSQDNTVQIWETVTGALLHTYRDHTNVITSLAWAPDSSSLASGSSDSTVQIWEHKK